MGDKMDPDAALKLIRKLTADILKRGDTDDLDALCLAEAFEGLDRWLSIRGCKPRAWQGDEPGEASKP